MSEIKDAVIISAVRTPTGKFLGSLTPFSATDLGAIAVKEAVTRAGIEKEDVDEVIMGCVVQAGLGQAPARQSRPPGALRGQAPRQRRRRSDRAVSHRRGRHSLGRLSDSAGCGPPFVRWIVLSKGVCHCFDRSSAQAA